MSADQRRAVRDVKKCGVKCEVECGLELGPQVNVRSSVSLCGGF